MEDKFYDLILTICSKVHSILTLAVATDDLVEHEMTCTFADFNLNTKYLI